MLARAMSTTGERRGYVLATLGWTAALVLLGLATPFVPREGGLRDGIGVALVLALVIGWLGLSYHRAHAVQRLWLLGAPAVSLLGGYAIMVAMIEGEVYYQGDGPWWLWLLSAAAFLGVPALLAWPAAWFALAKIEGRRACA